MPIKRCACCILDARHYGKTRDPRAQPGLFRIVSAARRAVLVPEERAGSVSGAEPRSLRFAGDVTEKHETEFAALTSKPEELTRIARRSFELRQELSFLFESNERNFRLLVRAEEQRRIPDGNADRRQAKSAGAAVRKIDTVS